MKSSDLLTGEMSESLPSLAHEEGGEGEIVGPDSPQFWIFVAICCFLVLFAGLMSGLTLGLLSFEEVDLLVLMKSGTEKQRKHANPKRKHLAKANQRLHESSPTQSSGKHSKVHIDHSFSNLTLSKTLFHCLKI